MRQMEQDSPVEVEDGAAASTPVLGACIGTDTVADILGLAVALLRLVVISRDFTSVREGSAKGECVDGAGEEASLELLGACEGAEEGSPSCRASNTTGYRTAAVASRQNNSTRLRIRQR